MSRDTTTSFAFTQRDVLPGEGGKLDDRVRESRTAFEAARTGAGPSSTQTVTLSPATSSNPEPRLVLPDPRPDFAGPEPQPVSDNREAPAVPDMKAAFQAARQSAATQAPIIRKLR